MASYNVNSDPLYQERMARAAKRVADRAALREGIIRQPNVPQPNVNPLTDPNTEYIRQHSRSAIPEAPKAPTSNATSASRLEASRFSKALEASESATEASGAGRPSWLRSSGSRAGGSLATGLGVGLTASEILRNVVVPIGGAMSDSANAGPQAINSNDRGSTMGVFRQPTRVDRKLSPMGVEGNGENPRLSPGIAKQANKALAQNQTQRAANSNLNAEIAKAQKNTASPTPGAIPTPVSKPAPANTTMSGTDTSNMVIDRGNYQSPSRVIAGNDPTYFQQAPAMSPFQEMVQRAEAERINRMQSLQDQYNEFLARGPVYGSGDNGYLQWKHQLQATSDMLKSQQGIPSYAKDVSNNEIGMGQVANAHESNQNQAIANENTRFNNAETQAVAREGQANQMAIHADENTAKSEDRKITGKSAILARLAEKFTQLEEQIGASWDAANPIKKDKNPETRDQRRQQAIDTTMTQYQNQAIQPLDNAPATQTKKYNQFVNQ